MSEYKVRDTVSLHEETVKNAEKHMKTRERKPSKRTQIDKIKVDPEVWKMALKLSHHQPRRIEVIGATEVIVHNKPVSRKLNAESN